MKNQQLVALLFLVGINVSCSSLSVYSPVSGGKDSNQLLVVDCLLPGQLRNLGQSSSYLTARRPIKTTARNCAIRGGEYVAYDRANFSSALKVWLAKAQLGDAKAQTYVGEIYAKGLGVSPNYTMAAQWYLKAAQQGNSRAQLNLGFLYEQGLGVTKNVDVAMQWYQKASGLPQDIPYASTLKSDTPIDKNYVEVSLLQSALKNSQKEGKQLELQLQTIQQQLSATQKTLVQDQKREILATQDNRSPELQATIVMQQKKIRQQELSLSNLQQMYQQKSGLLKQSLEEIEKRAKQLSILVQKSTSKNVQSELRILKTQEQLARTRQHLLELKQNLQKQHSYSISQQQDLQHSLASAEAAYQQQQKKMSALEADKQVLQSTLQKLQKNQKNLLTAKPIIEVIDPPVVMVRGHPVVTLRSVVAQRTIIGKVKSGSTLLSLLVNDHKISIDEQGIFQTDIAIQAKETPVSIVAVNKRGDRTHLSFLFLSALESHSANQHVNTAKKDWVTEWKNLDFGSYHALIIGNENYPKLPSLDTPINDAREVEQVLKNQYGFKTQLLIDASRYQILSALNKLRVDLTEKDNLLIYYAGHGELDRVNMRGHWLPVDADADNSANWISTIAITDILNVMSVQHIMVVADSCYSGAMTRGLSRLDTEMSQGKKSEWLKAMLKSRSRTVLTSGGLKPVMDGGGGQHSVFADAFIHALKNNQGLLEGQKLYRSVSTSIVAIASNYGIEQVPRYAPVQHAGHEAGEFFFVPR